MPGAQKMQEQEIIKQIVSQPTRAIDGKPQVDILCPARVSDRIKNIQHISAEGTDMMVVRVITIFHFSGTTVIL
jgi:hypothetical protein